MVLQRKQRKDVPVDKILRKDVDKIFYRYRPVGKLIHCFAKRRDGPVIDRRGGDRNSQWSSNIGSSQGIIIFLGHPSNDIIPPTKVDHHFAFLSCTLDHGGVSTGLTKELRLVPRRFNTVTSLLLLLDRLSIDTPPHAFPFRNKWQRWPVLSNS